MLLKRSIERNHPVQGGVNRIEPSANGLPCFGNAVALAALPAGFVADSSMCPVMLAPAIRERLSIAWVEPTMALLLYTFFRSCLDEVCKVHVDTFGGIVGPRLPGMNTSMGLSRFLAPGLVLLLFGQARGQPPEYWYVSTRDCL
jgi:hypothetical protein